MSAASPVIATVGHVALRSREIDLAVQRATSVMGLRESERDGDTVYLTHGRRHHSLQYIAADQDAVDHIGLEAAGEWALDEIRRRVRSLELQIVSDRPLDRAISDGFAFIGPEGFTYEVYAGMPDTEPAFCPTGVRPSRLGHVTLNTPNPAVHRDFFVEVLDFRLTDVIDGEGFFLRCNAEHHGVGLLRGDGVLHHHAWQVTSIADLARLGDILDEQGDRLLWGPLRHGAGNNIAAYFTEPAGTVVEYYTDMEHIYNEASFAPRTWKAIDERWYALWTPGRPDDFRAHGLPPASRDADGHIMLAS
jgi:catechol-2,3-dioxygenase